ncbi:MAG: thiol:disulfide interchange protein DsbA/DsbL [Gammaproteobacteria bacterium]
MRKILVFLLAMVAMSLAFGAQNKRFDEGIEYQLINPPQPTTNPAKVEVVELFWYGCPHCFVFEPHLNAWLERKPANVEFIRIPATLNPGWAIHARAYYTAEVLGVLDKIHEPLFHAMHVQKRRLNNEAELAAFFAAQGVSEEDFRKTFNSFAVETKLRRAAGLVQRYGVSGVPAVVINGKYRTDGSLAGSYENLLQVMDYLIQKESAQVTQDKR